MWNSYGLTEILNRNEKEDRKSVLPRLHNLFHIAYKNY